MSTLARKNGSGAIQKVITSVQPSEPHEKIDLTSLDWGSLRFFLICAEEQSFKAASQRAHCSVNTMRNHIERLEIQTQHLLFRRSFNGTELTRAGRDLLHIVQNMRAAANNSVDESGNGYLSNNELRLSITEGLGAFWLVPRLAEFQQKHVEMAVHLDCKMAIENMNEHNVDVAVQLERSTDPSLQCVRLGTMHLIPFASHGYINKYGSPRSMEEALRHRLVVQVADQSRSDVLSAFTGALHNPNLIALRTNTSSAHYWAVARGIGIGMLPTYARAITNRVVPIDVDFRMRREIWLIYRPDISRSKGYRQAIAWIRQSFDARRYPWFSDSFVHPNEFEAGFSGTNVVQLFAGFMDSSSE